MIRKWKMLSRKRKILVFLGVFIVAFFGCSAESHELYLKTDLIELEYGEALSGDLLDYVDLSHDEDVGEIQYSCEDIEDFDKILEVGEYEIQYQYYEAQKTLKVVVKDTTAPEVTLKKNIELLQKHTCQYEDYLNVKDLSKYHIDVKDDEVNYEVPGQYIAEATISDIHDNSTKIKIPVTIHKTTLQISKQNLTLTKNNQGTISVSTNSDNPVVYSSSNESVATIDKDGTIKALKAGNTIITATVDGQQAQCQVTVKENVKPKATSSQSTTPNSTTSQKPTTENQTTNNTSYTVYITKTGKRYHRDGCRYLSKSQIAISKSDAMNSGYSACSICKP